MTVRHVASPEAMLHQMRATPGLDRLLELGGFEDALHPDTVLAILDEAARFSAERLAPFDRLADRAGCRLEDGRVVLAPGHGALWSEFRAAGWTGLDVPAEFGGQALPALVAMPVQELFDRGSVSFGMAPGAARSAARLLQTHASVDIVQEWVPRLCAGDWGATICISEPDAGSDVGRIRTTATRGVDGLWRVEGEKIWISYGDHDLTPRLGHLVLARSDPSVAGVRGLSLFLVPSVLDAPDGATRRNAVVVRRIEEKLGLHASPTCALGFERAQARLIGVEGRGVAQLFRMIVSMRLQVGTQGLGLATDCLVAAAAYAADRRQGGPREAPPVPIEAHADVQLMLMGFAARVATLRGVVYAAAAASDLAEIEIDAKRRVQSALLLGWLLPIVKNSGAETAFDVAAEAVLLFGGAGYTTDQPVERHLRDARILAIYEGTTGMQAIDLVRRRWLVPGTGFEAFAERVAHDVATLPGEAAGPLGEAMDRLAAATAWLRDPARTPLQIDACARAGLRAATVVTHGWIAARLAAGDDRRLAACGRYGLSVMTEQLAPAVAAMRAGAARVDAYTDLVAEEGLRTARVA